MKHIISTLLSVICTDYTSPQKKKMTASQSPVNVNCIARGWSSWQYLWRHWRSDWYSQCLWHRCSDGRRSSCGRRAGPYTSVGWTAWLRKRLPVALDERVVDDLWMTWKRLPLFTTKTVQNQGNRWHPRSSGSRSSGQLTADFLLTWPYYQLEKHIGRSCCCYGTNL